MHKCTVHTGEAKGADETWVSEGKKYGVDHIIYTKKHHQLKDPHIQSMIASAMDIAAPVLGRPRHFPGIELVYRDWMQVNFGSTQVMAISAIIWPGEKDWKGFVNGTAKPVVAGGTGWTVQFGIQEKLSVYVFDMLTNLWYAWSYVENTYARHPTGNIYLNSDFTGVGSRELSKQGLKAIEDTYAYNDSL